MGVDNVVLVTIDSLRYDRALAPAREPDPALTLANLASTGYSFTRAFANGPNTPSSFPTILTGTYPMMYGGYRYLDERRPFLSETLSDANMSTVGYHSNPHLGPEKNYNRGFDTFNDDTPSTDDVVTVKNVVDRYVPSDTIFYRVLRRVWHYFAMTTDRSAYTPADEITNRALEWFETGWDGSSPFFMWVHYMDVHYPFTPPSRCLDDLDVPPLSNRRIADLNGRMQEDPESISQDDRQALLSLYDGEMRFVDENLARLLQRLRDLGLREETAVVVTADHGEAFGEHDRFGHHPVHYDELLHVPLVVDVPGHAGGRIDQQVSLIDLVPTLYDLLRIQTPPAVQGQSLLPLMRRGEWAERPVISTSRGGDLLAMRTPEWKCLWNRSDDEITLYEVSEDPGETRDVSDDHPAVVARYRGRLQDHVDEARSTDTELPAVEETEEVKQRLEDLGYVE